MSTNALHYGSGSIISGRANGFTHTGSPRPSRPGQLSPGVVDGIAGGTDPSVVNEIAHETAAALLDRVHHQADPEVVARVLTLVEREGVDVVAELWSKAEPDTLPGILWRLYMLRSWMRRHDASIARLWRIGEPVATSASAIAGVDATPDEDDIARTADSILAGAFTGDFAVALERAAAFTDVVALGMRLDARHLTADLPSSILPADGGSGDGRDDGDRANATARREQAARLLHTAGNLFATAKVFRCGARSWRAGTLE